MTRLKCKALVTTKNGQFLRAKGSHNHNNHYSKLVQRTMFGKIDEIVDVGSSNIADSINVIDNGENFKLVVQSLAT